MKAAAVCEHEPYLLLGQGYHQDLGLCHAGALPLCAPAADGDVSCWDKVSPDC